MTTLYLRIFPSFLNIFGKILLSTFTKYYCGQAAELGSFLPVSSLCNKKYS